MKDVTAFWMADLIEYLANATSLLINAGIIAAALWAARNRKDILDFIHRVERWIDAIITALQEYTQAVKEAARKTDAEQPPSSMQQAQEESKSSAQQVSRKQVHEANTLRIAKAIAPLPKTEPEKVKAPGCLLYFATLIGLLALGLFASQTGKSPPPTKSGSTDIPTVQIDTDLPLPYPAPLKSKAFTVPRLQPETSCRELARKCSSQKAETEYLRIVELNRLTDNCNIRFKATIQIPSDWECPSPLRSK